MAKGITYFLTDSNGNTHTRYSAGHLQQLYTHAVVNLRDDKTPCSKAQVSFASRIDLARSQCRLRTWGKNEVVAVRAYPGKLAVEPMLETKLK